MPITPDPILTAAREEFARHGYARTGMAAIAKRAGIAVGSLYNSFPSKRDLFTEVYLAENDRAKQALLASVDWSDPRVALPQWVTGSIEAAQGSRILAEWFGDALGPHLRAVACPESRCGVLDPLLAVKLQQWREEGRVSPDVDDDLFEELYAAMIALDRAGVISPRSLEFLMDALLDKVFPVAR